MIRRGASFLWRWTRRLVFLSTAALLVYLLWLPDVGALVKENPKTTSLIELRRQQAKEKNQRFKPRLNWRPLSQISPHLIHAVLLSEDDTFYRHQGFDLEQIEAAVKKNLEKKRFAYGGSTLTQQLARTLFLSPHKNLLRKAKEALITIQLEHKLSKRRILELYLNVAEWGNGVYGAEAAAQAYFGIPAADLSPDQAVALASVLPSPRRWSPHSERNFMARRRTQLLERMDRAGYLPVDVSSGTEADASTEPVTTDGLITVPMNPAPL